MTPTHGTPLSPDQAAYDADQDARIRAAVERVVALDAGTTTYHYREAGGARGSTTSVASIPAGAVVLRAVTS